MTETRTLLIDYPPPPPLAKGCLPCDSRFPVRQLGSTLKRVVPPPPLSTPPPLHLTHSQTRLTPAPYVLPTAAPQLQTFPPPPPTHSPPSTCEEEADSELANSRPLNKHILAHLTSEQILLCCHCSARFSSLTSFKRHSVKGGGCVQHPLAVAECLLRRDALLSLRTDVGDYLRHGMRDKGTRGQWLLNSLCHSLSGEWPIVACQILWSHKKAVAFDSLWNNVFPHGTAIVGSDSVAVARYFVCDLLTDCFLQLFASDNVDFDISLALRQSSFVFDSDVSDFEEISDDSGSQVCRQQMSHSSDCVSDFLKSTASYSQSYDIGDMESSSANEGLIVNFEEWQLICALVVDMCAPFALKTVAVDVSGFCESVFETRGVEFETEWFECHFEKWLHLIDASVCECECSSSKQKERQQLAGGCVVDCGCDLSAPFFDALENMKWSRVPKCLRAPLLLQCAAGCCQRSAFGRALQRQCHRRGLSKSAQRRIRRRLCAFLGVGRRVADAVLPAFVRLFAASKLQVTFGSWLRCVLPSVQSYMTQEWWLLPPTVSAFLKLWAKLKLDQMAVDISKDEEFWSATQRALFQEVSWFVCVLFFSDGVFGVSVAICALVVACVDFGARYHALSCPMSLWNKVLTRARALAHFMTLTRSDALSDSQRKRVRRYVESYLNPRIVESIAIDFL